ncbi:MAG: VCBS repeat-containing protein [Planctomycetota bacterium]|nr:VCBS repeat-containing protein [Planctomycetota bacterium]
MTMRSLAAFLFAATTLGVTARGGEPAWKRHDINPKSEFEAAGAFDVDGDGKLDVVSGSTWYRGPDWQPFHVRDITRTGSYLNCFAALPIDVNGDGHLDFMTCSYFAKNVGWVENPGKTGDKWTYHEIDLPGPCEAAQFVDLTGDGKPELLPNSVNVVTWYELEKAGPNPVWKKHDFGNAAAGHGVGSGDVNGDGRVDLLTPKGWFEAPADPSRDTWTWHGEWDLGATGIEILARDVDGDGLSDVVYGMGHNYGLFWARQSKGPDGKRVWTKHEIDPSIASVHTLIWADIDGDGKAHELVTGKRVYAHEIEPGATDGSIVAWYDFDKSANHWNKHVAFQGEPAKNAPKEGGKRNAQKDFPPGTVGTGLQMTAIDFDGDGDLDLLCPGKSGLYWLENPRK